MLSSYKVKQQTTVRQNIVEEVKILNGVFVYKHENYFNLIELKCHEDPI